MSQFDSASEYSGAIAWMADNSVAANLLMIVLLAGGLLMFQEIQQEVFPEVAPDSVTVTVPYPGASPEEVEQSIVLAVESAVRGLEGIDETRSSAREGSATIDVELLDSANTQETLNDIKSAVDRITSFPEDAEDPEIRLRTNRRQVLTVLISGDVQLKTLERLAEETRDQLTNSGKITLVETGGLPPPEISIEISQDKLRKYGLTHQQVAQRVEAASVEIPGGNLETSGGEILLRTSESRNQGHQFRDITIISNTDGTRVTLGELAEIEDGFQDTKRASYFNDERAVRVDVFRVGGQTPLEISAAARDIINHRDATSPETVSYEVWNDSSEVYEDRMNLLLKNSYLGLGLVLLILGLFLEVTLAFWVTVGILISLVGAVLFMPSLGVSLNMISLFAFLLTLGIVVDDAIVVGEAVYKHRSDGKGPLEAAIDGTREVAQPVVFAVLTTVAAFSPLLFVPGEMGQFFEDIPLIVIPIFLLSLVECLFILPAHLAHSDPAGGDDDPDASPGLLDYVRRFQRRIAEGLEHFVETFYRPLAHLAVKFRYVTLAASISALLLIAGVIGAGIIKFNFMPKIEDTEITVSIQMPFGTHVDETREANDKVVDAAKQTLDEFNAESELEGLLYEVGVSSFSGGGPGGGDVDTGSHIAQTIISLSPASERDFTVREFTQRWREHTGELPGVETIEFSFDIGPGSGANVSLELRHNSNDILRTAAADLAEQMAQYNGVFDVNDGFQEGKPQVDLSLSPEARALGLTEQNLATQIRSSFYGFEALREQRERSELRVYVRRPESERDSLYHLEETMIRTPDGGEIPLHDAAQIEWGTSYTEIEREGGFRAVDVTGDIDEDLTTGTEITGTLVEDVIPQLKQQFEGLTYELSGQQQQRQESLGGLRTGFLLALLVMYGLMAIAFRSYIQPIIIMAAIPFGFAAATCGHLMFGFNLSLISMMGMVALSGVVVNDSLVLIAAVNDYRRDDELSPLDAVVAGGVRRFRPILLTSLTTFFGLAPMIFETSVQAQFLIPMALSLGFGILFVTVIALIIVPAMYMAVVDIKRLLGMRID